METSIIFSLIVLVFVGGVMLLITEDGPLMFFSIALCFVVFVGGNYYILKDHRLSAKIEKTISKKYIGSLFKC